MPLDDQRRWYRYQHLFSDVLQSRLLAGRPIEVAALHRRASEWFQQAGDLEAAGVEQRLSDVEAVLAGPREGLVVLDEVEWARLPAVMATHRAGLALVAGNLEATSQHARVALARAPEGDLLSTAAASALLGLASWTRWA